jgi:hypothetical protein
VSVLALANPFDRMNGKELRLWGLADPRSVSGVPQPRRPASHFVRAQWHQDRRRLRVATHLVQQCACGGTGYRLVAGPIFSRMGRLPPARL